MKQSASSMHVIRVLPIVRGFRDSEATYFSSVPYSPGSVITVPFRSKERSAVVVHSGDIRSEKSEIRSADFRLKKIRKQKEATFFSRAFLETVLEAAEHYGAAPGEVLSALTPSSLFDEKANVSVVRTKADSEAAAPHEKMSPSYVQSPKSERLGRYKKAIQNALKKKSSVLVLVPTVEDARDVSLSLKEARVGEVCVLSSAIRRAKQVETWNRVVEAKEPIVVVLTPGFLSVPVKSVGLCILERSGSAHYFGRRKPFLDARVVFEMYSKRVGARFISGDVLIPLRDTKTRFPEELDVLPLKVRPSLIDMTDLHTTTEEKLRGEFVLLSPALLKATRETLDAGENVFWFVARRGLYPQTVCRDCGNEHICLNCGSSLVLHEKKRTGAGKEKSDKAPERFFLCHRCGEKEGANVVCRNCSSWRLVPLGIGVERVFEEASSLGLDPLILSQDRTPTKKSKKEVLSHFFDQSGAPRGRLLIGTDLALPLIEPAIASVCVVSMDSRLARASFDAEESALRLLLRLVSMSMERSVIQTRRKGHRIFNYINGAKLNRFRKEEAELREAFAYPPFGTLIEFSFVATKEKAEKRILLMSNDLSRLLTKETDALTRFPLQGTKKRGVYRASLIIKMRETLAERSQVREYFRLLSPTVQVRVDPENLW